MAFSSAFEYNQVGLIVAKPKLNVEISDEINLGASIVWDSKVAVKETWGQLVYKPKGEPMWYFGRFDKNRSQVSAGVNGDCDECGLQGSAEAVYCFAKDFKGFKGQPVMLRGGYTKKFNDKTSGNGNVLAGSSYKFQNSISHKYDSNWTVSVTQSFDAEKVGTKTTPYHVGFAAAYKL